MSKSEREPGIIDGATAVDDGSVHDTTTVYDSMIVPKGTSSNFVSPGVSLSVSDALVDVLVKLGVEQAFGIIGGGIAPFCEAINRSSVRLMHTRHEAGAAFAAIESSLASGRLTVVVATTGPGLTNLYTGMIAARSEGAKVLFVSGGTPAAQRGRGAFQETSGYANPLSPLFTSGMLFHYATIVEHPAELELVVSRLASGLTRANGFVAHIGLPIAVQTAPVPVPPRPRLSSVRPPACDAESIATCVDLLSGSPFVIWAGFGARHASGAVKLLAERANAHIMCSPRGKGIIAEDHPLYLGVTGLGGHGTAETYVRNVQPSRALVLGSRLGEFTSFWSPELVPPRGFVHVDLDTDVFGAAYPEALTLGVQAEIRGFVEALLESWPHQRVSPLTAARLPGPAHDIRTESTSYLLPVRPSYLMRAIQREIVERSDAIVLTEAGNAFALGSYYLRFSMPGRYRVSTSFGSMGQAVAGVLGAAVGRAGKAVAIVGDGAMLMHNEINTAATYGVDAIWIVLNDARYGMIAQGMESVGWQPFATNFPRADFVAIARAMGGDGVRIECECNVEPALRTALAARGPFVVDVVIDPTEVAPSNRRNQSLLKQGVNPDYKR